jgi:hypothetical protein
LDKNTDTFKKRALKILAALGKEWS